MKQGRYLFCDWIKFGACLLIINFHSDILFPERWSILAVGGDMGNNLFFAVSGFLLYDSIAKTNIQNFPMWYGARMKRLLPTLLFFYLISIWSGSVEIMGVKSLWKIFIYPTPFWFTGAILWLYAVIFFAEKIPFDWMRWLLVVAVCIIHLLDGGIFWERYGIGAIAMLAGCCLKKYIIDTPADSGRVKNKRAFLFLVIVLYAILKLARAKNMEFFGLVHLLIGICCVVTAVLVISIGYSEEKAIRIFSQKNPNLNGIVVEISKITLQVYLVQSVADRWILKQLGDFLPFPVSYFIGYVCVVTIADILFYGEAKIRDAL